MKISVKGFRVELIERDMGIRTYAVTNDGRIWTVRHRFVRDQWSVANEHAASIMEGSELWQALVNACDAFGRKYLDA